MYTRAVEAKAEGEEDSDWEGGLVAVVLCPLSFRDPRRSHKNMAKILAGLNPNLLKQVESLPLKEQHGAQGDTARTYPPSFPFESASRSVQRKKRGGN